MVETHYPKCIIKDELLAKARRPDRKQGHRWPDGPGAWPRGERERKPLLNTSSESRGLGLPLSEDVEESNSSRVPGKNLQIQPALHAQKYT